ncbi:VCBS repeat-containing protein [Streptomyces sp. 372A]|uniref:FG-GAP repeat domain-containing protein n=1 Tax=Streptomyces sp. SAS_281 TaxID=3412744 RepID=UPI00403C9489
MAKVDHTGDGRADGIYTFGTSGSVNYRPPSEMWGDDVGYGWDIYNMTFSPGNLGGDVPSDILARDAKGDLYLYLGYTSGKLAKRAKVGYGFDIYTAFAGNGDLDGDGRNDFVARDKSGVLWLYKGTGDAAAPYAKRTKIGSGWNQYNWLISTGDVNKDGRTDLFARDSAGVLWQYAGTGNAAAPYKPKAKVIGGPKNDSRGWNMYSFLY